MLRLVAASWVQRVSAETPGIWAHYVIPVSLYTLNQLGYI